jgi:hypothetical protein
MDVKFILRQLIEFYQNDFMCAYKGDGNTNMQIVLLELIMHMTRYVNDFRYHDGKDCGCSPESHIKEIIGKNEDLLFGLLGHEGRELKKFYEQL